MKKILIFLMTLFIFSCSSLTSSNSRSFHSKPGFLHTHATLIKKSNVYMFNYSIDGFEKEVKLEKINENEYLGNDVKLSITKGGDLILTLKDKTVIEFYELYESDKEDFGHKEDDSHHGHTH